MRIIQATEAELPLIVSLFDQYRQFYRQSSDLIRAEAFLRDRIERNESVIFLAEIEDGSNRRAGGFVQLYPSFSSVQMKRLWVLNDLFVHADFRHMGIATALIERSEQLAKQTDASALMLETEITNVSAQRLYDKTGFKKSIDYFVYYRSL